MRSVMRLRTGCLEGTPRQIDRRIARETWTMRKLPTREVVNMILAIEDSILLKWRYRSNPDAPIQFIKRGYLPPPQNRQGTLQVWFAILALAEDPFCNELLAETR